MWAEGAQLVRCVAALLIAALQGWGPAAIRQRVVGSAKDVNEGGGGEQREGAGKKKRERTGGEGKGDNREDAGLGDTLTKQGDIVRLLLSRLRDIRPFPLLLLHHGLTAPSPAFPRDYHGICTHWLLPCEHDHADKPL